MDQVFKTLDDWLELGEEIKKCCITPSRMVLKKLDVMMNRTEGLLQDSEVWNYHCDICGQ